MGGTRHPGRDLALGPVRGQAAARWWEGWPCTQARQDTMQGRALPEPRAPVARQERGCGGGGGGAVELGSHNLPASCFVLVWFLAYPALRNTGGSHSPVFFLVRWFNV